MPFDTRLFGQIHTPCFYEVIGRSTVEMLPTLQ